jgi:zona occludens toxin
MSIIAYVGLPGAGKSYSVVANQIMPALKKGRRVVTNIPLYKDRVREVTPKGELVDFPTEAIASNPDAIYDYCAPGSIVILDEVWRLWPAGQKANQVPESFRALLTEHRHMVDSRKQSMQIVLVTQDLGTIGMFARRLVEMTVVHSKLTAVGMDRKYRWASYQRAVEGPEPPSSRMIRQGYGTYRKEVFRLYKSHTQSEASSDGADERGMDRRMVVWRRPAVLVGLLFVVAAPVWAVSTLWELVAGGELAGELATSGASPELPASGARSAGPAVGESRVELPRTAPSVAHRAREAPPAYRVVGWVETADAGESVALMQAGEDPRIWRIPVSQCWEPGDGLRHCAWRGRVVTELGVE